MDFVLEGNGHVAHSHVAILVSQRKPVKPSAPVRAMLP